MERLRRKDKKLNLDGNKNTRKEKGRIFQEKKIKFPKKEGEKKMTTITTKIMMTTKKEKNESKKKMRAKVREHE